MESTPTNPTPSTPGSGTAGLSLLPGQVVGHGRFTLIRKLGKGGMGVVWLARDQSLSEEVALKFLASEIGDDPSALDDMRRETQKSRKLTHPNIIRIHDFVESKDEPAFISMEYIEGQPLNALKTQQPQRFFPWETLKPLVKQLCDALEYAHSEKVIHRDLKPANMMLDSRGRLKLADFGIAATASESRSRVSLKHATSGTVVYMSPQQMNGQRPQPSDDIYALGATLYELLTSRPPFYSGDIVHQVQNIEPQPLAERLAELELSNEIPADVSAMVMACLSKDPAQRPSSAQAVAEWIGLNPATAPVSEQTAGADVERSSRSHWLMVVGGVVILLLSMALWVQSNHKTDAGSRSKSDPNSSEAFKLEEGWAPLFGPGVIAYGANNANFWRRTPDGNLVGLGNRSGLLRETEFFTNFQFKAEVWLDKGASGSLFFHETGPKLRIATAYRVVLDNTPDGKTRTGSLADFSDVSESPVKDESWFEVQAIMIGNRIVIRINQRIVVDCRDPRETSKSGRIAFGHKPGPSLMIRHARVRSLPSDGAAALKEVRKELPGLP